VAEKFHAMVKLGMVNSRMKDFYDIWILCREFEFKGNVLEEAIEATFQRQRTKLPTSIPPALSEEFFGNKAKKIQWRAFVGKSKLDAEGAALEQVAKNLVEFLPRFKPSLWVRRSRCGGPHAARGKNNCDFGTRI